MKTKAQILSYLVLCLGFYSCGEEGPTVNNDPVTLKGAYILYTGSLNTTDYAFFNAESPSITNNVYSNTNPGKALYITPGDMTLNTNQLYITTLGPQSSPGTIYKINADNNQIADSLRFGSNPYGFVINNNRIIVSNFGSSSATILDLDFNILNDSISVGAEPRSIIYGMNKYLITKAGVTSENSVAFVDEVSNQVMKLFYPAAPVSAVFNLSGFFVSGFSNKKIYRIDSDQFITIDSFSVPTLQFTIGDLIFKTQSQFFIIAANKEIWEATINVNGISFRLLFPADSQITILTAAYEQTKNEIYIGDANDFNLNGEMHIIDAQTGLLKSSHQLGGKNPVKVVFKY